MKNSRKNDSCESVQACYSFYHVPIAAALWCGVPSDQVEEELRHAVPIGESSKLDRAILSHPYLKCLEPRIRAIHIAIDNDNLQAYREGGRKVTFEENIAYEQRYVYGNDLKAWAKRIAPNERPTFLYTEIERNTHSSISVDSYKVLKATHDAMENKLSQANDRIQELSERNAAIESEHAKQCVKVDKHLTTTERNTLLTIIAGLCDYSAIIPTERGSASQIAKMTEEVGAPVTDDTIRKMLTKIPDALESRKK